MEPPGLPEPSLPAALKRPAARSQRSGRGNGGRSPGSARTARRRSHLRSLFEHLGEARGLRDVQRHGSALLAPRLRMPGLAARMRGERGGAAGTASRCRGARARVPASPQRGEGRCSGCGLGMGKIFEVIESDRLRNGRGCCYTVSLSAMPAPAAMGSLLLSWAACSHVVPMKNFFLISSVNLPVCKLRPFPPLSTTPSSLLQPLFRWLWRAMKSPLSLFLSRQNSSSSLSCSS